MQYVSDQTDQCLCVPRLVSIDTEFRTLRLRAEDSSGRQHVVTVKLKPKVREHTHYAG